MGIISTLTALLLPALSVARQEAMSVQCLSNLRQMALAAHAYVAEFNGYYPPAHYWPGGMAGIQYNWDFTQTPDGVVPGLLWAGQTNSKIQQCPVFEGNSNSPGDPCTGYNYNTSYIGHGSFETVFAPAKAAQIRHPERCALFGDGQWSAGANKFMRAPLSSPGDQKPDNMRLAGTQGFRHRGRTNVAFADGHAESLKKGPQPDYAGYLPPELGFLSNDNSMYGG